MLERNLSLLTNDSDLRRAIMAFLNRSVALSGMVLEPPPYMLGVATALYVLVFLLGLFGNFAVIAVVLQCRSMRTFINILFLNLCLADLLVLLITGPTAVADIYNKEVWYLGRVPCKLIPFLENMVGNASVVTILAIGVERYRVACSAPSQSSGSWRAMYRTLGAVWLASSLSALPFLFITELQTSTLMDGSPVQVCKTSIVLTWHKAYVVLITAFFFVIPLLIIVVLYAKVCFSLIYLVHVEKSRNLACPNDIVSLKRQMIQIIVTVVLVFFVCHTPYRAISMWIMFEDRSRLQHVDFETFLAAFYFTRILLYSNHAVNPFVYNFVSRKFRRALVWVCFERRRKNARLSERDRGQLQVFLKDGLINRTPRLSLEPLDVTPIGACVNGRTVEENAEVLRERHHRNDFMVLYANLGLFQ